MTATGLEVRLHEGLERAEATRVARTVNEVVWALREIDRVHLLHGTRATWVMADMDRREQDLILRLEPRNTPTRRDLRDMMIPAEALVQGTETLAEKALVPELFTPRTVTRVAELGEPKAGIQTVTLSVYNGRVQHSVLLSDQVRINAAQAVKPYEVSYGSVSGMLSTLRDPLRGAVRVTVRDNSKRAIEGIVPDSLAEALPASWRHRVALIGKVKRNSQGQPIRVDVDNIELLPEGSLSRPSTNTILGIGKDWLDGLSVDEFLREVRGG